VPGCGSRGSINVLARERALDGALGQPLSALNAGPIAFDYVGAASGATGSLMPTPPPTPPAMALVGQPGRPAPRRGRHAAAGSAGIWTDGGIWTACDPLTPKAPVLCAALVSASQPVRNKSSCVSDIGERYSEMHRGRGSDRAYRAPDNGGVEDATATDTHRGRNRRTAYKGHMQQAIYSDR